MISDRKTNPKRFFSFINSTKQDCIGASILIDNNKGYISDIEVAKQFINVTTYNKKRPLSTINWEAWYLKWVIMIMSDSDIFIC